MEDVYRYIEEHLEESLADLARLCELPSIRSLWSHPIRRCMIFLEHGFWVFRLLPWIRHRDAG